MLCVCPHPDDLAHCHECGADLPPIEPYPKGLRMLARYCNAVCEARWNAAHLLA